MNKLTSPALGLLLTTLLTACGGGGSGGKPAAPSAEQPSGPATLTGRFVDGPVSGLRYSTASQTGFTNSAGEFSYLAGETVSFYVGDILIGRAKAADTITPFDLAGIAPPVSSRDIRQVVEQINDSNKATSFELATNIAAFLQTIDEDGDPGNGQQIPTGIHALAAGGNINFMQNYWSFYADVPFRKLVAAGRSAGLWNGSRAIKDPLSALDALYSGLGLTPAIDAVASHEWDNNGDGSVDDRTTYSYDARGNITLVETDIGTDGTVDFRNRYTYNANNQTLSDTIDGLAATVTPRRTFWRYDANGYTVLREDDANLDGVIDSRTSSVSTVYGYPIRYEYDTDANGIIDRREVLTLDVNGHWILVEVDNNADDIVDARYTATYDANGHLTLNEGDDNADGIVDQRSTFAYDANGNRIVSSHDTNADGIIDSSYIYGYDANGNRTLYKYISADVSVDLLVTYIYNTDNKVTRMEYDFEADGAVELHENYYYDVNGKLLLEEDDYGVDGSVDYKTTYSYDVNGDLARQELIYVNFGATYKRSTYTYDADGNRILFMFEIDHDLDGTLDLAAFHSTYIRIGKWRASGLAAPVSAVWTGHPYFPE